MTTGVLKVRKEVLNEANALTIGALAALSLSVGLSGAIAADHSAGRRATVAISGSELGRVLVDGRGRTLYLFQRDRQARALAPVPAPPHGRR